MIARLVASVRTHLQALPRDYRNGAAVVLGVYLVLYGSLLGYTEGLPYVMDGNESFSSFVHASNLYRFPFSQSLGLTDEAFSPSPAAHPYVYTHQGNFPRLYAFALYLLGARTIESQIVITTFTVGLLSVLLMYHYFSKVSSTLFATVASLVAITDYVLYMQWQVNTWRVWHAFFFFLALLCVHGVAGPRRRAWLWTTVATYAALFYCELAFGVFVAAMTGCYAVALHRRRLAAIVQTGLAQAAGAVAGVAVLLVQLIAYLGWNDFRQDLRITYSARNMMAADPAAADRVREFMESRHIAFWYNFASVEYQRSLQEIVSSLTQGYFVVYTPTLWYLVTALVIGWLFAVALPSRDRTVALPSVAASVLAGAILLVGVVRLLVATVDDTAFFGTFGARISGTEFGAISGAATLVIVAVLLGLLLVRAATWWGGLRQLPPLRMALAGGVLLLAEHAVLNGGSFFDGSFAPLWARVDDGWFPAWLIQIATVAAAFLGAALVLGAPVLGRVRWTGLAQFLVCGLLGYAIVYVLSPGYVQSGYLQRSVIFASLLLEPAIALVVFLVAASVYGGWGHVAQWSDVQAKRWSEIQAGRVPTTGTDHRVSPVAPSIAPVRRRSGFRFVFAIKVSRARMSMNLSLRARPRLGRVRLSWLRQPAVWARRVAARAALASPMVSRRLLPASVRLVAATGGIVLVLLPGLFWVKLQVTHAILLPPTHFTFMKQLGGQSFRGASFAANTYAAPIHAFTGEWAYFDTRLALPGGGRIVSGDTGLRANSDPYTYLWLADRDTNERYRRPDYFLCFTYQDLRTAVQRVRGIPFGCSRAGVVADALDKQRPADRSSVGESVVARDRTGRDVWAIVKLDWSPLDQRTSTD